MHGAGGRQPAALAERSRQRAERHAQHGDDSRRFAADERIDQKRYGARCGKRCAKEDALGAEALRQSARQVCRDDERADTADLHDHEISQRRAERMHERCGQAEYEDEQAAKHQCLTECIAQIDKIAQ